MSRTANAAAATAGALLLIWGFIALFSKGPDEALASGIPDSGSAAPQPGPEAKQGTNAGVRDKRERTARRTTGPATNVLRLDIRAEGTGACVGKVYWTTGPEPPSSSVFLAPDLGYSLPEHGCREVPHNGSVTLRIPSGAWTWLRATCERPRLLYAYALVAPFEGEKKKELRLSDTSRTFHVFLLAAGLAHRAPHREVRVYQTNMTNGGTPVLVARKDTDSWGYARFGGLDPGAFLICAPGAKPGDPYPHTQRLVLPPGMPTAELPCTLAVPEPRHTVRLEITAAFKAGARSRPTLFLKRRGTRRGEMYPVPGILQVGKHTAEVRVPAGRYALSALPIGQFEIGKAGRELVVPGDDSGPHEVEVRERTTVTDVAVHGIQRGCLPLIVYPRDIDEVVDDFGDLLYAGPYTWRSFEETIVVPPMRARLIARSRGSYWISRQALPLGSGRVEADMTPACRLLIYWTDPAQLGNPSAVVEVSHELGTATRALRLQLGRTTSKVVPALGGTIVVPYGRVHLAGKTAPGGSTAWTREFKADRAWMTVSVGTQ